MYFVFKMQQLSILLTHIWNSVRETRYIMVPSPYRPTRLRRLKE